MLVICYLYFFAKVKNKLYKTEKNYSRGLIMTTSKEGIFLWCNSYSQTHLVE